MQSGPFTDSTLAIGDVAIAGPAVQAALSGYSDLPMRLMAREYGAPYAQAEVVLDELVLRPGKLRNRILAVPEQDHPVGGQLMGTDPATFGAAAAELVRAGYDIVDVNFGCPVNKVLGRCRGGYLLQHPDEALAIVDAVVQAVAGEVPVTVKMRRGYDDSLASERAFFAILDGVFDSGVVAVTLHPRTVVQKYEGPSRWEVLARVKRHLGDRTLLGSGDLYSAFDVVRMLRETGVDGVAIARGCIGYPFVFEQVHALLEGRVPMRPTCADVGRALRRHLEIGRQLLGPRAQRTLRTHAIKYAQFHPDPLLARRQMVSVRDDAQLDAAVASLFDPARYPDRSEPLRPEHAIIPARSVRSRAPAATR